MITADLDIVLNILLNFTIFQYVVTLYLPHQVLFLYVSFTENVECNMDASIQIEEPHASSVSEVPAIKEYDPTIDERLPDTVTLLTTPDGGKLYLIGTAHFSVESQNDVSKVTKICTCFFLSCSSTIMILQMTLMLIYLATVSLHRNYMLQIIQAVQPHIVVVELCKARVGILQLDEEAMFRCAQDINYRESVCIIL